MHAHGFVFAVLISGVVFKLEVIINMQMYPELWSSYAMYTRLHHGLKTSGCSYEAYE